MNYGLFAKQVCQEIYLKHDTKYIILTVQYVKIKSKPFNVLPSKYIELFISLFWVPGGLGGGHWGSASMRLEVAPSRVHLL